MSQKMSQDAGGFIIIPCFSFLLVCVCLPSHLLVASPSTSTSSFSCRPDQRDALLGFIRPFSINDPSDSFEYPLSTIYCYRQNVSYPRVASWREDGDCCSWDGITCDNSTGDVIGLDLTCAWLRGSIHSGSPLFSLRRLRSLSLVGNDLLGSAVPPEIGMFSRMTLLNLSSSGISGVLPNEISKLSKLISLDLSGNLWLKMQDRTMRMLVSNLTQMEELNLGFMDMSTVTPVSFSNLSSSLISLELSFCLLGGKFPVFIFELPNLQVVDLSSNRDLAISLPESNWSPRLDFLSLGGCSFTGSIPNSFGNLSRLTYLDLSLSNFSVSGEDSNHRFSLPKLQELYMRNSNLSKFPSFLSRSKELRILRLEENKIPEIPGWFWSIGVDTLESLSLDDNIIGGSIPQSICRLTSLINVGLTGNHLSGVIPQCLGNLTNLKWLYLSNNSLSGPLPSSLANCTSLVILSVGYNSMTGTPPAWPSSISSIDLGHNNFCGRWSPDTFLRSASLDFIYLSNNKIEGPLPLPSYTTTIYSVSNNHFSGNLSSLLCNATNLQILDLSNNKFEGPLPLPSYTTTIYSVSNNHFSGNLSSLLCNATNLQILDLSNNSLNGVLPDCLKSVTIGLRSLNLRENEFSGQIPDIFHEGSGLVSLDLSRNQFEGMLPISLSHCKTLEALEIGSNKITGSFPNWLGDLPLKVLSLRSNNFHGHISISEETRNFSQLRILDLSSNNFEGNMTEKFIGKLLGMSQYDIYAFPGQYMTPKNGSGGYYSVLIDLKGVETEMVQINVQFAMLDLSSNHFHGEIPRSIGLLKSLRGLNFSHNHFTGTIPPSVGNLTYLESLDLSSNHLMGEIPEELGKLTFLGFLDLSWNNLTGPIPSGGQFNTFLSSSFQGNPELCGILLTRSCGHGNREAQPPSEGKDGGEEEGEGWLEWYVVLGFGSGMGIGISLGYMVLEMGRPLWLVRMVIRLEAGCWKRLKRKGTPRRNL